MHPTEGYFAFFKSCLTDKYYIAVVSLIGIAIYVILYRAKKGYFKGIEQPVALGFGTSLGGIFTGLGILLLGLDKSACQEVNDVRAFIMLGGVSAIWIASQSLGSKYKDLSPKNDN